MACITTFEKMTMGPRDIFEGEDPVATPEPNARMADGWDSLGNVRRSV